MRWFNCKSKELKKIIVYVFILFLFIGTIDVLYSGGNWFNSYLITFVYTFSCSFFCTTFLCAMSPAFFKFKRGLYYSVFLLLVAAGIFLGVVTGTLILEGRLFIPKGSLLFSLIVGFLFSAGITAYFYLKDSLAEKISLLKVMEVENERLKRLESETRLRNLQAKLNPHFLFNTLNSIAALVYDDPEKAETSIVKLADLYHKVLDFSSQTLIPMDEELELTRNYLELEKLRFEDRLKFKIGCPEDLKTTQIPGLLIEPLVENAVKYAKPDPGQALEIEVKIEEKEGSIGISVSDNGQGFELDKTAFGFGLFSIQERLRLIYEKNYRFKIQSSKGKGTDVYIQFPLKNP
ncbi:MAG: histidine kinase [Candidatus Aminicenantes bacterium]|nr:histidine kinase [Candidatus Aminicenantes bacterium]